jgi:hypothetical protein
MPMQKTLMTTGIDKIMTVISIFADEHHSFHKLLPIALSGIIPGTEQCDVECD